MKAFFQKIGDFFLDKNNSGDEKRFFGVVYLGGAFVGFFITGIPIDRCIAMATIGGGLLGMAIAGDVINPKPL